MSDRLPQYICPIFAEECRGELLADVMDRISDEHGEYSVYFGSLQPVKERVNWTVASIALHREVALNHVLT